MAVDDRGLVRQDAGMQITLKVESGPQANARFVVEAGKPLTVGRTDRAVCAIPSDNALSRVHFEVVLDGEEVRLRDLKSSNGTYLNGAVIVESALREGDEIFAGRTRFSIHIKPEGVGPSSVAVDSNESIQGTAGVEGTPSYGRLIAALERNGQPLYAVLDGARDAMVLKTLLDSGVEFYSLLEGQETTALAPFIPYVASFTVQSPILLELLQAGWGKSWGVCLSSMAEPWEVAAHLRRLLSVGLPGGRSGMLRFFDPRVMRALLPSCSPGQLRRIFGPVRYFMMEDEEPEMALAYAVNERGLRRCRLALKEEKSAVPQKLTGMVEVKPVSVGAMQEGDRLVLRQDQMESLEKAQQASVERSLLEELKELSPDKCRALGDEKLGELVRYGSVRPKRYGLRKHEEIVSYLQLMLELGRNFDEDPALPWAKDFLTRRIAPAEKLKRLWAAAREMAVAR